MHSASGTGLPFPGSTGRSWSGAPSPALSRSPDDAALSGALALPAGMTQSAMAQMMFRAQADLLSENARNVDRLFRAGTSGRERSDARRARRTALAAKLEAERKAAEEERAARAGPTVTISGPTSITDIAAALKVRLDVVLDHLEALGEDLEALEQHAREQGDSAARVEADVAEVLVQELGGTPRRTDFRDRIPTPRPSAEEATERGLVRRAPVVTVMGHVDHGKTTLLDYLRRTSVAASEAGGITQAISAFSVRVGNPTATEPPGGGGAGPPAGTPKASDGVQPSSKSKSGKGKDGKRQANRVAEHNIEGLITFLDTPGHQLFANMRAKGTAVTDVVVLVVAADDGLMQQTRECIELLQSAAGVPVVVALTKIDRVSDVDEAVSRISAQLLEAGVQTEPLGGEVPIVPVSAVRGDGIDELKEVILLQSEILELRADLTAPAEAAVIEAKPVRGLGIAADCIVRWGTLKVGDAFVIGSTHGRVRTLLDDSGERIQAAPAGFPVRIVGLHDLPAGGETVFADQVLVVETEDRAREVAERRARRVELAHAVDEAREAYRRAEDVRIKRRQEKERDSRIESLHRRAAQRRKLLAAREALPPELEEQPWERELHAQLVAEAEAAARGGKSTGKGDLRAAQVAISSVPEGKVQAPLIVRADSQGSLEALETALSMFPDDEVVTKVVRRDVGEVTPADVEYARQVGAKILAFNVRVSQEVAKQADQVSVSVVRHNIIYHLLGSVAEELGSLLPPVEKTVTVGVAQVQTTFPITTRRADAQMAAGCLVTEGIMRVATPVRVERDGALLHESTALSSLKRFKDDVNKVEKGQECGLAIAGFSDYRPGDKIVLRAQESVHRALDVSFLGSQRR